MTYDDFWSKVTPGLLNLGLGLYNKNQAQNEAESRLRAAQGPVYKAATDGATGLLSAAGANPDALAADRFAQQQALVKPVQDRQLADLQAMLRARGQLGIGVYNPGIEGFSPNGMLVNPQLAAYYAAQAGQRSKDAYNSLDAGQTYASNLVNRAKSLQDLASNAQQTGIQAQNTQPSRATGTAELLKGGLGVLKDAGVFNNLPGMLSSGWDSIKGLFGGDSGPTWAGDLFDYWA